MSSDVELAYWAGIVDGEGCIQAYLKGNNIQLRIDVANTNIDMINWIHGRFNGSVQSWKRKAHFKTIFVWRIYSGNAVALLRLLIPYLVAKKRQAELFVELAETLNYTGRSVPAQLREHRVYLIDEIRNDKRKAA